MTFDNLREQVRDGCIFGVGNQLWFAIAVAVLRDGYGTSPETFLKNTIKRSFYVDQEGVAPRSLENFSESDFCEFFRRGIRQDTEVEYEWDCGFEVSPSGYLVRPPD